MIGGHPDRAVPRLRLFDDAQLDRMHAAALRILEEVGVRVANGVARDLLLGGGARRADGDVISIPAAMVEDAIQDAPGAFVIHDRNGAQTLRLGEGQSYFGLGVTALFYLDPADGTRRDFTFRDFEDTARLADGLTNIDFVTTPGVVRPSGDVPIELVNQREFLALANNTAKPLMVLVANGAALADVFEMAAIVRGGHEALRAQPFVVPYLNPVSPLVFNEETLDKLLLAADWGIPVVCQGAPQIGGSAPATLASGVALAAAETLAGLVLSQLRRPGTPYITGTVPFVMDMRSGNVASTGPDMLLWMIAAEELARRWGIPSLGVGGGGDSKLADEQAAMEPAFFLQGVVMGGADLLFDVGNIECGLVFSPEVAAYADEAIGMYRHFAAGMALDDESLALDVVRSVGPGGFFLGEQHTLAHFRELWSPTLASWEARASWEEAGGKTMAGRARERVLRVLEGQRPDPLDPAMVSAMEGVVEARRRSLG